MVTLAVVINLPAVAMAALYFAAPGGGYFDALMIIFAMVYSGFVVLWAICISARLLAPLVTMHPIVPIFNGSNGEHQEQRHMCLGARFSEWEANFKGSS